MHRRPPEIQIGKEGKGISSDFDPTPATLSTTVDISAIIETHRCSKLAGQSISNQHQHQSNSRPHLAVLIPPISSPSQQDSQNTSPFQPHHQDPNLSVSSHEPIFSNPSPSHSPLSTLHKRSLMNPPPSRLSYSRSLSSLRHYQQTSLHTEASSSPSFSCCGSFVSLFPAKFFTFKHLCPFRLGRLRRTHLQFLIVLFLPSFYFLVSNTRRSVLIDILSVVAFLTALLISFNLALPRLPSIRLFLTRSLPVKLRSSFCATKPSQPMLWSIGSKPKLEKIATSGCLVQVYSNGDVYEGEFHKGKCSGSGVYYYHMSGKYEGDWIDGKYDGCGVETWARGSRYRGQYKQGLRHGIGVYRFHTGDVYSGEWSNGQSHGCGVHTCEDGSRYVGEFKWGVKHGYGHYHFRNGDIYAGEYFADKMHGFGIYKFGNGHQYEGAWHEGRRQGLGIYTFRNGEMQSGHWQNGVLDIPSTLNTALGASYAVNHTKVLNTVQEARQAAEKAYSVPKVDGRVNAAVSAANKAANAARVAAVKAVQNRIRQDSK